MCLCRTYRTATARVPPTRTARAARCFRSRSLLAVGPRGQEQRSHFDLQPRRERRERAREKKSSVRRTQQAAGNFPPALRGPFCSSRFPFYERGDGSAGSGAEKRCPRADAPLAGVLGPGSSFRGTAKPVTRQGGCPGGAGQRGAELETRLQPSGLFSV